jgi:gamma-glutamyltranspeptidase/glutathione hydrolase
MLLVLVSALSVSAASPSSATARNGMVVSDHRLASEAGVTVLRNGGNAIDAAVTVAFALTVVHPSAGNIGGGGFLVYCDAQGNATTFDFRETAPAASSLTMFLDAQGWLPKDANHKGIRTVGVPGTVAGLLLAHERLGLRPRAELVQPAIDLAEKGFPISEALHKEFKEHAKEFREYPASARIFLNDEGEPRVAGEIWRQPDLAETLKRIRDHGADGFYRGRTAELIAAAMRAQGGLITMDDLAAYRAVERKPVRGSYRGFEIVAMGPPSSGGIALIEILNILEGFPLREMDRHSAAYLHVLTEAMRPAFADRARYLGDPDFNSAIPVERLLSKEYAARLRGAIRRDRAGASAPGDLDGSRSSQTTHLSVVDAKRNAVSLTYTLEEGYGSRIVVDGAGFLLNNEMGDFNPIPGRTDDAGLIGTPPNFIAPRKRMLSSMTPTVVLREGKPVLAIGSPGGRTIINTVLEVILNVVDHGMPLPDAIAAGRFHHQWLPDVTTIEKGAVDEKTLRAYEALGHKTKIDDPQGRAMGVSIDHARNLLVGVADPRSPDGAAVGY